MSLALHKYLYNIPLAIDSNKILFIRSDTDLDNSANAIDYVDNINLLIGPNNSGKSRIARAIAKYLADNNQLFINNRYSLFFKFFDKTISSDIIDKILERFDSNYLNNHQHEDPNYLINNLQKFVGGEYKITFPGTDIKKLLELVKDNAITEEFKKNFDNIINLFIELVDEKTLYDIDSKYNISLKDGQTRNEIICREFRGYLMAFVNDIKQIENITPKIYYIPNIRTLRYYGQDVNVKVSEKTFTEYFHSRNIEIIDGLKIYDIFFEMRNDTRKKLTKLENYENFLSMNFFNNKPIHFMTKAAKDDADKILKIEIGDEENEIHNLGDGIQQIITLTYPLFFKEDNQYSILFIEEPELNLHPGLEKKFFDLCNSEEFKNSFVFFFVTHSNHLIDKAIQNEKSIFKISKIKKESTTFNIIRVSNHYTALEEMGVTASSVLMANGVIWVEGPSDVIYIRKWLELYQKEQLIKSESNNETFNIYKEGLHFTFQVLATSLWNHAGFWNPLSDEEFVYDKDELHNIVNILTINKNNLLVIDKDDSYELDKKPSQWKSFSNATGKNKACLIFQIIGNEKDLVEPYSGLTKSGTLKFWINNLTIETYLEKFLKSVKCDSGITKKFTVNFKIKDSKHKIVVAKEIVSLPDVNFKDFCEADDDLYHKIEALYKTILSWNF